MEVSKVDPLKSSDQNRVHPRREEIEEIEEVEREGEGSVIGMGTNEVTTLNKITITIILSFIIFLKNIINGLEFIDFYWTQENF